MSTDESSSAPMPPVAQRIQGAVSSFDRLLLELARRKHPTVAWWWGIRPRQSQRHAQCYVCDEIMSSWSSGAQVPGKVVHDIKGHKRDHIDPIMIMAASAEAAQ